MTDTITDADRSAANDMLSAPGYPRQANEYQVACFAKHRFASTTELQTQLSQSKADLERLNGLLRECATKIKAVQHVSGVSRTYGSNLLKRIDTLTTESQDGPPDHTEIRKGFPDGGCSFGNDIAERGE